MTELERKAVKKSLVYNRKYSEDRDLEDVLKHPEKYVDSYAYTMNIVQMLRQKAYRDGYNVGAKENGIVWHDLRINPDDFPEAGKLVRVRLSSGMERICETEYYEPSEDEIGFGKLIILFYELNGEWVDDNEVIAWCELPKFEVEE